MKEISIKLNQPKSFDDIHHSLELVDALDLVKLAEQKIEKYKHSFVESFLKTADEVIEYIPKNQLKKYKLCDQYLPMFNKSKADIFDGSIYPKDIIDYIKEYKQKDKERANDILYCGGKYRPSEKMDQSIVDRMESIREQHDRDRLILNCRSIYEQMKWINPTQKVFIVDTINKKIEVLWGLEDPTEMHPIAFLDNQSYSNCIHITLEGEKLKAVCYLKYEYGESIPDSGAVYISTGGGGYWNKTTSVKRTSSRRLVHSFNIRNNTYEGIVENEFIN